MRIVTSPGALRRLADDWRGRRTRVAFVPTMGCLHAGHLSLVERARQAVGRRGVVLVSIYVNPAQFGPTEDFARYPRTFGRDRKLCAAAGVDVIFAPRDRQMYPSNGAAAFSTFVVEERLSGTMEGASRPGHFRGVATVVAKLFHLIGPTMAVFGAKDFQQVAVVRRMVRDLDFPVRIIVAPICREPDGLALSSRNQYLSPAERAQAVALYQAIQQARQTVRRSRKPVPAGRLKSELRWWIEARPAARVDYIEFFEPATLRPVARVGRGTHVALAVFIGKTRLIDNGRL